MNQESIGQLDHIIIDAAVELFAAYRVMLEEGYLDDSPTIDVYAATIGYTSQQLKGALIITLYKELVIHSLPPQFAEKTVDSSMVADWTGELANQLLGRIKAKMVPFGVEIILSTPVVFKGQGLNLYPQQADVTRTHGFGHGTGALKVVFQAKLLPDFELQVSLVQPAQGLGEGEVSLF